MTKIYIWGAGDYAEEAYKAIDLENNILCGLIDGNPEKQGTLWKNEFPIVTLEEAMRQSPDYYLISVFSSAPIIKQALSYGIQRERLIRFWEDNLNYPFVSKFFLLEKENEVLKRQLVNAPYEYGIKPSPTIIENDEMFYQIREEGKSLTRFGDGEFEMIRGNNRPWFQNADEGIANRLLDILQNPNREVLMAIADDFASLEKYTEKAAESIREYMTAETRNAIMEFLPMEYSYGDAYITRPYYMYKDKSYAGEIVKEFKRIFYNRDIILVENPYSRIGIGNDLFEGTKSVSRIIAPPKNAFEKYDELLLAVQKNVNEKDLVLVSLGPTATVLAYDLGVQGIQTLDIGQLDTEYEWYLRGATDREEISGKSVAELSWWHEPKIPEEWRDAYEAQIVKVVE